MTPAVLHLPLLMRLLAHGTVRAITDKQDSRVSPGILGFVVVAILGVATWLLIRSMTRQFRKIDLPEGGAPIPSARRSESRDHEGSVPPSDTDPA